VLWSCTVLTALVGKLPASITSLGVALLLLQHHRVGFFFVLVRRKSTFFPSTALHIIGEVKNQKNFPFYAVLSAKTCENKNTDKSGKTHVLPKEQSL